MCKPRYHCSASGRFFLTRGRSTGAILREYLCLMSFASIRCSSEGKQPQRTELISPDPHELADCVNDHHRPLCSSMVRRINGRERCFTRDCQSELCLIKRWAAIARRYARSTSAYCPDVNVIVGISAARYWLSRLKATERTLLLPWALKLPPACSATSRHALGITGREQTVTVEGHRGNAPAGGVSHGRDVSMRADPPDVDAPVGDQDGVAREGLAVP
jgi:hypothetical protein